MIDEVKELCNSRLNLIKILPNKKWDLNQKTLGNFYKSLKGLFWIILSAVLTHFHIKRI